MLNHTPGPWGWTYDGSGDYSVGGAGDPQVLLVANVYAWRRNSALAAANCTLIAAAPEMLALLREYVDGLWNSGTRSRAQALITRLDTEEYV